MVEKLDLQALEEEFETATVEAVEKAKDIELLPAQQKKLDEKNKSVTEAPTELLEGKSALAVELMPKEAEGTGEAMVEITGEVDGEPLVLEVEVPKPEVTPMTEEEIQKAKEDAFNRSIFGRLLIAMDVLGFSNETINMFLNSKYYYFAKDLGDEQQRNAFILFIQRYLVIHDAIQINKDVENRANAQLTHPRIRINLVLDKVPDDWLGAMIGIVLPYLKQFEADYFVEQKVTDITQEEQDAMQGKAI